MVRWQRAFLPVVVALGACEVPLRDEEVGAAQTPAGSSSRGPEDPGDGSEDEAEGTSGGEGSSEGDGSTGALFDVPPLPDPPDAGVCDAVDLLFVIDNSGSMADEQANLIGSVPAFIDGIRDRLGVDTDYHVGVVSTDESSFNAPSCRTTGALITRTEGDLSSDEDCGPYVEGTTFMTPHDDLEAAFSCAAQLGIDGNGIERPMDAMTAALRADGDLQSCNGGFLREEALLVVVVITDEEDDGDSAGSPASWYESVSAAKGGDDTRVVVLSLVGHPKPNDCIPTQWTGMQGAEIATRIMQFTSIFPNGYVGDVCAQDYAPFFGEAIEHIDTVCSLPAG